MKRRIIYIVWVIGFFISIIVSFSVNDAIPFMVWILFILTSNWAFQAKDLSKRVKKEEDTHDQTKTN